MLECWLLRLKIEIDRLRVLVFHENEGVIELIDENAI